MPAPPTSRPGAAAVAHGCPSSGSRAGAYRSPGGGAGRRKGSERPDALRRLLPQALVVAFLAGGTTAFVAKDKAIELSVDGKPRTLHTFADDVAELLADEGVAVGAHDVVAPAPGTGPGQRRRDRRPLRAARTPHSGRERRRGVDDGAHRRGALSQLGVRAEGAYLSLARSQRIGRGRDWPSTSAPSAP